jgi:hypothetical protein
MDWKKRTQQEINQALEKKDLTGGYEFLPWVWYMRKFMALAFFLNGFMGWQGYKAYLEYGEAIALIATFFFGICVTSFIGFMLYREHRDKKKGISR